MSDNEAFFARKFDSSFGNYVEGKDDTLHPEFMDKQPHYGLTETQYFGFVIPEHAIHGFLYLWHHPNLGVVSAGPLVYQGKKTSSLAAELFDYRLYMPDKQLNGGLEKFTLDNSYSVEMPEHGRTFYLRYDDPQRQNYYDLTYNAVSDPMMWPNNTHFEQVMKVTGELSLRGNKYDIDCYHIRDRSWGEARLEDPMPAPPAIWATGVFDENFAFNLTAHDDPELNPIWRDKFDLPADKTLKFGWLIVDGEPVTVANAHVLTTYNRNTMIPTNIHMQVTDAKGREFDIHGEVVANCVIGTWLNLRVPVCMTRWTCNGRIGWGDSQGIQWTDFVQAFPPSAE